MACPYQYKLVSTRNAKLEKDGIVSINMPPLLTCPGAGECKHYCYAQVGMQAMGNPKRFRLRTLQLFKDDPKKFEELATFEIHRAGRRFVRWNDSGDIMSLSYLKMMVRLAKKFPDIKFYAYSKSIKILLKYGFKNLPKNLKVIQSFGGRHDHLIDKRQPYAKVFLTEKCIPKGFVDCSSSDYLAATSAKKIAIVVHGNRRKKFKGE